MQEKSSLTLVSSEDGDSVESSVEKLSVSAIEASSSASVAGGQFDFMLTLHPEQLRAYVLNLDRDPERLSGFTEAVKLQQPWILGVLERVSAVDGPKLFGNESERVGLLQNQVITNESLEEALANTMGADDWNRISPGAIGLALSHRSAWEDMVLNRINYGLVFEDDLRFFAPGFKPAVRHVLTSHVGDNNNFDLVYLQHCEDSADWPRGSPEKPAGLPKARMVMLDEVVPCTAAYMLSQRAAQKLLTSAFPMEHQLDRMFSTAVSNATQGLNRVIFEPALAQVGPESFSSNVQHVTWLEWLRNRIFMAGMAITRVL